MKHSIKNLLALLLLTCHYVPALAQIQPTPAANRGNSTVRTATGQGSLLSQIKASNIGPTIFNGRVVDLAVNPENSQEFFAVYASGGLWHTQNNGNTFEPFFQNEDVITIGDVDVDWKNRVILLGTGESNSSRSSYAGNGIYVSRDFGKSWTNCGLSETHHIGRVVIHPKNPEKFIVGAMGHLYTENPERGIFITEDGGKSWNQTLYINNNTGIIDIVLDPVNPDIIYAAAWERSRKAWDFQEAGEGSAIYKSTDGGITWSKISQTGFTTGKDAGRIGLAVSEKENKTYLYAIIDNQAKRKEAATKEEEKSGLQSSEILKMSKDQFLKLDEKQVAEYLKSNNFPAKYTPKTINQLLKNDKITLQSIADYNKKNANESLFDTPVTGGEVYLSTDGGMTWNKTHVEYMDDFYFTYGYYFGQIRVHPKDPSLVFILGVPILKSEDYGKTWKSINGKNVHVDHHALWVNPENKKHLINGNDGGVNISYDGGDNWFKCIQPEVGQFYYVNVDQKTPFNIYGGTQDNGVWMGPSDYTNDAGWMMQGEYPYKFLMGGDGMQVQIDQRDENIVYTGFQFGNYFKLDLKTNKRSYITPKHDIGADPYRWNWQTPILLSSHHQDILYMGSQFVMRSMNQGKDFEVISPDLTNGKKDGDVPFATITTIDESKLSFGLLYAGTDDGNVYMTKDGGNSWNKINEGLPQGLWVSRIQASVFEKGRVYLALNGYRNDHFNHHIFVSNDFGKNWNRLGEGSLPQEPVNVIKEDPSFENIIYTGTDHGTYISKDFGKTFTLLTNNIPAAPVHDLVVHKRDKTLVMATHGRSIYTFDLSKFYSISDTTTLLLFSPGKIRKNANWGKKLNFYSKSIDGEVIAEIYSASDCQGKVDIKLKTGEIVKSETVSLKKGLFNYNLSLLSDVKIAGQKKDVKSGYLKAGDYIIQVQCGQNTSKGELTLYE